MFFQQLIIYLYLQSFVINKKSLNLYLKKYFKRSRDLNKIYYVTQDLFTGARQGWQKTYEKSCLIPSSDVILIPNWRYHDIDTPEDWKRAEKIFKP